MQFQQSHSTSLNGSGEVVGPPPPLLLDDGPVYAVHEILNSQHQIGHLEYLIDWEGYGPEERSWVAQDDILDPALLTSFHADHPQRPALHGRGRPRHREFRASGAARGEGGNVTSTPDSPSLSTLRSLSPDY
ncbi:chromobox protein homolog 2-like [Myxocyprinus asiaticus]|uniref:chromobox protein homolog 2-like n=1 Tax=Myxocyprinus asiaticus TaxID=70543 RepID=UPI00222351BD|nr:chromobox protein homolog 2-like [Myxocyprinus asiaticus]